VHSTHELGESDCFDDICDVNFIRKSFAGVDKLLVLGVSFAATATISHPELLRSAEIEILSGLNGFNNLLLITASECNFSVSLNLVQLASHNNIL